MKNYFDFDVVFVPTSNRPGNVTEAEINGIENFVMKMYTKLSKISLTDLR